MPPRLPIPGSDELIVPAYFVTDENSPDLARWKQEHPDWFVAGTWTPPRRRRLGGGGRFDQGRSGVFPTSVGTGRVVSDTDIVAAARSVPLTDPSQFSVREFMALSSYPKGSASVPIRVSETPAIVASASGVDGYRDSAPSRSTESSLTTESYGNASEYVSAQNAPMPEVGPLGSTEHPKSMTTDAGQQVIVGNGLPVSRPQMGLPPGYFVSRALQTPLWTRI